MLFLSIFSNLDSFTITTGIISIVTAVLSFILAVAESGGNKKLLFGLTTNTLKRLSIYITLIAGMLTLYLNWDHQIASAKAENAKERKADSLQQSRYDSTLREINRTLVKQDITLYQQGITIHKQDTTLISTGKILAAQRSELAYQTNMFTQQKKAFDTTSSILHKQIEIQDGINQSLELDKFNRDLLNKTKNDVSTLNFPISNGMTALVTVRLYINGIANVFKDNSPGTHSILRQNEVIDSCIRRHFGHIKPDLLLKYWNFFSFSSIFWLDRGFQMVFDSIPPNNRISFQDSKAVEALGSFVANSEILYNRPDSYFQWDMFVNCGGVTENPDSVKNLDQILRGSTLHINIRYPRQKVVSLPISNNESETVTIDHFEISGVKVLLYGSTGQFTIPNPTLNIISTANNSSLLKKYRNE
jgi:hypothetical protein